MALLMSEILDDMDEDSFSRCVLIIAEVEGGVEVDE